MDPRHTLRQSKCPVEFDNRSFLDELFCAIFRHFTLFFNKNVVFPAQAEYSYFSDDFRLKNFLNDSL